MTTTISVMEQALWPFLLEPLAKPKFVNATGVLSKCIAFLAQVKKG